ncbi:MAG: family 43 glycosylhydrolase [Ruminococcus sp.]|nr:family 43 glycosylhydrolase [Ruminococcus sp.]
MKRFITAVSAVALSVTAISGIVQEIPALADNPLAQNVYTADPAPMVYNGTLYLYTSHDKDNSDYFYMPDWQCYSTTDMQNWTHHGTVLSDTDFAYAEKDTAWAAQCIERNGKFYMYCPLSNASGGGRVIGVAVSDSPTGPFKDAIGKPLLGPNWDYIDPTVFIDDDGQAYLYFGNPQLYYVKLNDDMISYSGEIQKVDMSQGFGKSTDSESRTGALYTEGPWFYKRKDLYYMLYAAEGIPENISYSTSTSPTGPWTYKGVIMPKGESGAAFTNHCGVADYKGHSYFFYHNQRLPGGGGFNRSVAVEEFSYNSDGTFPTIKMSEGGPEQLETVNPYIKNEAEKMCFESGIETEKCSNGGMDVANIENGDYVKVAGVDFGDGAETFTACVASATSGGKIEIHLDSVTGSVAGTLTVPSTDGWQTWKEVSTNVSGAKGIHDVYFRYSGGDGYLFNVDWWKFGSSNISSTTPSSDEIIFRDTFESGVNSWSGRGSAKVDSTSKAKYQGEKSLFVSGRESSWNGAIKKLSDTLFKTGTEYSFSVNVMSPAEKLNTFYLTFQYTDKDGETHYDKIARGSAMGGNWIQLSNTNYKLPDYADDICIYVETESGKSDFYIDDAVAAVAGTSITGAGNANKVILGDVDCDGVVDVFDLIAAKKGITDGFKSEQAKINCDVDRSGDVVISDVVLISDYLIGKISEFPNEEPPEPETPKSDFNYEENLQYKAAPDYYLNPAEKQGKVINETYTGINGAKKLNVYLPYGYDENKKYNIFYLMHGGGENENTIFSNDVKFNNMLDHMIANGDIEPMIVVTPTFNGGSCSAENVYKEMKESIVPFVEGKYSTYAENTTPSGLEASRLHRAYGGFSMGGGSAWNVLINDIDYFGYLMPLSGHCWGGAQAVADAVANSKYKDSTYILAATGTDDIAYGNLKPQIEAMKKMPVFTYTSDFSKGNLYFLEADGLTHWWGFVRHYVYDALPYFFHE